MNRRIPAKGLDHKGRGCYQC